MNTNKLPTLLGRTYACRRLAPVQNEQHGEQIRCHTSNYPHYTHLDSSLPAATCLSELHAYRNRGGTIPRHCRFVRTSLEAETQYNALTV